MRFLIMGAGSIGSYVGAMLSKEHDVVLVGRRDHVAAITAVGLTVGGLDRGTYKLKAMEHLPHVKDGPFDIILITVKSPSTGSVTDVLAGSKGLFDENTCICSMQNGLDNAATIAGAFGDRVLVVLTSHGVYMDGPGSVVHTGTGDTVVGDPGGRRGGRTEELARALTSAGIEARVSADIHKDMWLKAGVNAGINTVCAVVGMENGCLHGVPELVPLWTAIAREVAAVARSEGIDLADEDVVERTSRVAELTSENKCSMLQDVERGRRTEVDAITGVIVRTGQRNDVPVPVNETMLSLIKGIERTYLP